MAISRASSRAHPYQVAAIVISIPLQVRAKTVGPALSSRFISPPCGGRSLINIHCLDDVMTCMVRASRRVLASSKPTSTDSIWISESLLAESFRRFICIQSRHGSNVPGPMEARRRANKRRNASLAQSGSSPPIDPNILFGAGPHHAWWQTSNPPPPKPAIDSGRPSTLQSPLTLLSDICSASFPPILARAAHRFSAANRLDSRSTFYFQGKGGAHE